MNATPQKIPDRRTCDSERVFLEGHKEENVSRFIQNEKKNMVMKMSKNNVQKIRRLVTSDKIEHH